MSKGKVGRKKINCSLGEKQIYSFKLYPLEFQQMQIFYNKLKKLRPKYYIKNDEDKGE